MHPILVFDIETIPDVTGLRILHELPQSLSDGEVAEFAFQRRRQANGNDFLPHHVQRVCAISCALRMNDSLKVWTIGDANDTETTIIQRFFDGIERYTPQLVSWNGGGFDLPVLHYRALMHNVTAPRYWDIGDGDFNDSREFKWNNYISRYHMRHLDLMDVLAAYQPRANAPLDAMAQLCGFPGKLGMDGGQVWPAFQRGEITAIRDYCETDVLNTYLVFLKFQVLRGALDAIRYAMEVEIARKFLADNQGQEHWRKYAAAWK